MHSFAQIIFRDPVFQPYLNDLVKLVLMSGRSLPPLSRHRNRSS